MYKYTLINFKIILSFLFLLCFSSCFVLNHKFNITNDYIKSNHLFYQGFHFSELVVDSINSAGLPIKFEKTRSVFLEINNTNGKQSKKIFFYKPNSNYSWHYLKEWDLPILPIKMLGNSWYMIEGLVFFGNPTLSKFIYIDNLGNCHSYTKPTTSNW